jgi:dihydropteroate synthase
LDLRRGRRLGLGRRTLVMGVVNVTPDSFSDGGRFLDPGAAVEHALALAGEGADLLDLGGESTRPGSMPVSSEVEWRRIGPVLRRLREATRVPISVDTTKASVARRALDFGADLINDTSGLSDATEIADLVAAAGAALIVMHRRGRPATMQRAPRYRDLFGEINGFLRRALALARRRGVRPTSLVADPGIGFGKTVRHNLELVAHLRRFRRLKVPLLIGASRKSFIGKLTGMEPERRLEGSLAAATAAALAGAAIVRVHDVGATVRALAVADAIKARRTF